MNILEYKKKVKGDKTLFKEIMTGKFLNLRKQLDINVQEAERTTRFLNAKLRIPKHITGKASNVNDKDSISKATRGKRM